MKKITFEEASKIIKNKKRNSKNAFCVTHDFLNLTPIITKPIVTKHAITVFTDEQIGFVFGGICYDHGDKFYVKSDGTLKMTSYDDGNCEMIVIKKSLTI